jgi:hypothetical protein
MHNQLIRNRLGVTNVIDDIEKYQAQWRTRVEGMGYEGFHSMNLVGYGGEYIG